MSTRLSRDAQVATLVLDRPARRNALHPPLWEELQARGEELAGDPPRVLILTGEGEHFCSGMDLSPDNTIFQRVMGRVSARDTAGLEGIIEELKGRLDAIATLPCPVIVAIEGVCLGAGLELALCGDIRVAGSSARFSLPETRFGMVPDVGGTTRLTKLVGKGRAAQLILTASTIGAEKAERWGLVNEVVPDGTTLQRARELATAIVGCAPTATAEALRTLRAVETFGDDVVRPLETSAGARALMSGEVAEGIASFVQKRPADW